MARPREANNHPRSSDNHPWGDNSYPGPPFLTVSLWTLEVIKVQGKNSFLPGPDKRPITTIATLITNPVLSSDTAQDTVSVNHGGMRGKNIPSITIRVCGVAPLQITHQCKWIQKVTNQSLVWGGRGKATEEEKEPRHVQNIKVGIHWVQICEVFALVRSLLQAYKLFQWERKMQIKADL